MRIRVGVAAVFGALLIVGAVGAQTHTDPVGDSPGPDVSAVVLEHDDRSFTVHVQFANRTELEDDEIVQIEVDGDGNAATGDDGFDIYSVIEFDASEVLVWQTDDYVETPRATAVFRADGAHLTIPRDLVTGTVKVMVMAVGLDEREEDQPPVEQSDTAPDTGTYTHVIGRTVLERSTVTYSPTQPRAGKTFRVRKVSLQLSGVGTVTAQATCSATLAGKRLRATSPCAWRLPRTAKGKVLRISIAATAGAQRYTLPARRFVVR